MDWTALRLTLALAACTSAVLLVIGLPIAYGLTRWKWRGKLFAEALVAMPLVLPPTVLGFYVLMATGPNSVVGKGYEAVTGNLLPFSFMGILVGSVLYNMPFAIRPFAAAFSAVDWKLAEASWCLGVSRLETFFRIVLPLSRSGIMAGLVLTFAHTVGEFGVVLMVGGNIPGVTRTLSIAIYDDVQALDYQAAGQTALFLVVFSFVLLSLTYFLQRGKLTT